MMCSLEAGFFSLHSVVLGGINSIVIFNRQIVLSLTLSEGKAPCLFAASFANDMQTAHSYCLVLGMQVYIYMRDTFVRCRYKNVRDSNWKEENVYGDGEMQ